MGADWGPIFSGLIIAICLIIAIPFIDVEESDGTYKEEILQDSFSKNISYFYQKAISWSVKYKFPQGNIFVNSKR